MSLEDCLDNYEPELDDLVYIYKTGILNSSIFKNDEFKIDESMIGSIQKVKEWEDHDGLGGEYSHCEISVLMKNGKILKARDMYSKYSFIPLKDLKNFLLQTKESIESSVSVLNTYI